LNTDHPADTKK